MDANIVQQMKAEEADLMRKLDAVRAFLAAYGVQNGRAPSGERNMPKPAIVPATRPASVRDRVPLDRFTEYGREVVKAAITAVKKETVRPVLTRRLVELIEAEGVEIRGVDKVNALSALLARSIDLTSIGRRGWTLAHEEDGDGQEPEENGPHSTSAGGPDASGEGGPTPSTVFD
ncbi:hypothetical protein [Hansschlegelia sp. KR7-227]|uniref:hypothetical protein n=1 Tax=Hansschlegelia sp. KR7-227 TaxID=3400914 RepID=UPI003C080A7A